MNARLFDYMSLMTRTHSRRASSAVVVFVAAPNNATPPRTGAGLVLRNWQPTIEVKKSMPDPIVVGGGGQTIEPRSLYEYQRAARLGTQLTEESK